MSSFNFDIGLTVKQLEEVLELLKGDQVQRTQQMEQQTDNARYLNELNTVRFSA